MGPKAQVEGKEEGGTCLFLLGRRKKGWVQELVHLSFRWQEVEELSLGGFFL